MKNLSLALNIVLLLAVGFLYYKHFSGNKSENAVIAEVNDSTGVSLASASLSELPKDARIVFIDADSLFAKYELAKKAKAASESKIASYQRSYQEKAASFQKDYTDYMQKAGAGGYTKEQAMGIEESLQKRRDEIVAMEQNQDRIMGELDNSNVEVQKKIYEYLTRFNKEQGYHCVLAYTKTGGGVLGVNDSLDVTSQVVVGLNAEYKAGKGK